MIDLTYDPEADAVYIHVAGDKIDAVKKREIDELCGDG
jgi:uncharacterized protein YuzE